VAVLAGQERVIGDFTPSEFIRVSGRDVTDFSLQDQKRGLVRDQLGSGSRTILIGIAPLLRKAVTVTVYDAFPRTAIFEVSYTNTGNSDLSVSGWTNQHYSIGAPASAAQPAFWSYQSGSYEKRPDWVLPLKPGFTQENFLGMNASDYGGGTPVVDVWRRDAGIGVGHLEMAPKLVSLPVTEPGTDRATLAVEFKQNQVLKPGAALKTFRKFAAVHEGDYFQTLRDYRDMMIAQGMHFDASLESAFGPLWCAGLRLGQPAPQSSDGGARIRKEKSSTLYRTLLEDAGAGGTLPARTASKANTRRGSTEGGATGTLWAPRTTRTCGASAASRLIETS